MTVEDDLLQAERRLRESAEADVKLLRTALGGVLLYTDGKGQRDKDIRRIAHEALNATSAR